MRWTKYSGTAAKAGGNGENKPRPNAMGVSCLLENRRKITNSKMYRVIPCLIAVVVTLGLFARSEEHGIPEKHHKSSFMEMVSLFIGFDGPTKVRVRPLSLRVVDEQTGKPIPNVPIYYQLETVGQERFFLCFWKIDPLTYRTVEREAYTTDQEGCVTIESRFVSLRGREELLEERLSINIDLKRNKTGKCDPGLFFSFRYGESLRNPLENYIGVFLCAKAGSVENENRGINRRQDFFSESMCIPNSLKKDSERIEIKLKRNPIKIEGGQ